jgi:hypothetical protein
MVSLDTRRIMFVIIAFDGEPLLDKFLQESSEKLIKYASAIDIETMVVQLH